MILVSGGTGLVGAHLLFQLLKNGETVRAIHRPKSNLARVKKVFGYYSVHPEELFNTIQWVQADLTDIPALETAFYGVTQVYHTAALISFDPGDYKSLRKTNVEGTANMVNLCLDKGIQKLCYVSTIGTLDRSGDHWATEENEAPDLDANVYAQTKYEAELQVWRGSQEGLPVVIVNPGVIVGPGFWGGGSGRLFTTANKGYRYYPPGGTGFVSVGDVVKSILYLMDSPIKNERFIVVAENLSYKEVLEIMAPALGRPKPSRPLKKGHLQLLRVFDWIRGLFSRKERRITGRTIHSMENRQWYGNKKLREALGTEFEFEPLSKVLQLSCARFKEES
ncbi:MAG: NAD-dependent epimerase/dehydratase family protein [Bacteroidota bacterium]